METIINEIDKAIVERRKIYTLHNGVNIKLDVVLKGDTIEKRILESRSIAERLFDDVKRLQLL